MQKALNSGADALILDLKDSVTPANKAEARGHLAEFLGRETRSGNIFVRINPLHTDHATEDLAAILCADPDVLVLPEAEGTLSVRDLAPGGNARDLWIVGVVDNQMPVSRREYAIGHDARVGVSDPSGRTPLAR